MKRTIQFLTILVILSSIVGCKTTPQTVYVPLPVTDSSSESHHDTQREKDSIIKEKTIIVQVADSAMLARLAAMGVQVDESKQYIMLLEKELERKISELYSTKSDTMTRYKEIPVPYPVEVPVEKELTKWQSFKIGSFWWMSAGLAGFVLWHTRKLWMKLLRLFKR